MQAPKKFFIVIVFLFFVVQIAAADQVEVYSPETDNSRVLMLEGNELAELTIYLKSLGEMLNGYRVQLVNDVSKQIGENVSDVHGIVIFTKIPAGKYRIAVEMKTNERGGPSRISVGDLKLVKMSNSITTKEEKSNEE